MFGVEVERSFPAANSIPEFEASECASMRLQNYWLFASARLGTQYFDAHAHRWRWLSFITSWSSNYGMPSIQRLSASRFTVSSDHMKHVMSHAAIPSCSICHCMPRLPKLPTPQNPNPNLDPIKLSRVALGTCSRVVNEHKCMLHNGSKISYLHDAQLKPFHHSLWVESFAHLDFYVMASVT